MAMSLRPTDNSPYPNSRRLDAQTPPNSSFSCFERVSPEYSINASTTSDSTMATTTPTLSQDSPRGITTHRHYPYPPPHTTTTADLLACYKVDPLSGLTFDQVTTQRSIFGRNELQHEQEKSMLTLIIAQFDDLLVRILLLAAVVSFLLAVAGDAGGAGASSNRRRRKQGESNNLLLLSEAGNMSSDMSLVDVAAEDGWMAFVEPMVILVILVLNAVVGVWQESNAEKALGALKNLQPELARCLRSGKWQTINAEELVPGDVVEIRVGDKVPADLRMIQLKTTTLRTEQSQLTGESTSVQKVTEALPKDMAECEIQAKSNCLFSSTTIVNGRAIALATSTGMCTEIGKIQTAVQAAGEEETQTPLQQKLDEFGATLSRVIFVICVIVWLINWRNFSDPIHGSAIRGCMYYFKIAVALAVAAIPEGLPAVITTCLALGTRKMAQKQAIVRRLPSVETLGCTTVICSDKTGTLTTNEMSCVQFVTVGDTQTLDVFGVEGVSYTPVGAIRGTKSSTAAHRGAFRNITDGVADRGLHVFARCASLCNQSRLECMGGGKYTRHGEPTEAALRVLVEKLGCPDDSLNSRNLQTANRSDAQAFSTYWDGDVEIYATLEFTRDRKSMSMLCREPSTTTNTLFVKGAPESILERCNSVLLSDGRSVVLSAGLRASIESQFQAMAGEALRTLALAVRTFPKEHSLAQYDGPHHRAHAELTDPNTFIEIEKDLTFVGVVGLLDPPRPEVREAIAMCEVAGIRVLMITGDNKLTAEAISNKIMSPKQLSTMASYTGKEFEAMSYEQKLKVLAHGSAVFSRTEPKHKQVIVKILKDLGETCAMTGDGVNDAPALKQADIGIAMGITGTEVAKEASDMVLADDNFSTIVSAVEEGRSIYNNMKAFIRYLISSNIGEVASIFLTAALGIPEGLAPVQLLWVNLVTDGPPATALGFNPPDVDVMKKPPRNRNEGLISCWVFFRYMVIGVYVGLATVGIFVWWYVYGVDPDDGHSLVSFEQLRTWGQCHNWDGFVVNNVYDMNTSDPCSYFTAGKIKASTLSLTVLVVIEMFNALNALSEDGSLLQMPPWANPWLLVAIAASILTHCAILYVAPLASIFGVVPLTTHDWTWVVIWSFPVIIIDEVLKAAARWTGIR
eukprot:GHVS01053808.1.p1 GENE.GHVS01053808.1~~GHVS01053808.1.p1  ORF type:complete len:1139 (+),score=157.77 GHVS01053808.1:23-3439(+)